MRVEVGILDDEIRMVNGGDLIVGGKERRCDQFKRESKSEKDTRYICLDWMGLFGFWILVFGKRKMNSMPVLRSI